MAKTYAFRFTARKAEFSNGFVSVAYGKSTELATEHKEMTFADAMAHLQTFSAGLPAPHAAYLNMDSYGDRKPPGFVKAVTHVYKEV